MKKIFTDKEFINRLNQSLAGTLMNSHLQYFTEQNQRNEQSDDSTVDDQSTSSDIGTGLRHSHAQERCFDMRTKLCDEYPRNDWFDLTADTPISEVVVTEEVPNEKGIYLIYAGHGCEGQLIYVGKAGTITQKGWKEQGLSGRLDGKQGDIPRKTFFPSLIREKGWDGLSIHWFVTYKEEKKILPAVAEAKVMQEYFDKYQSMPFLNKEY